MDLQKALKRPFSDLQKFAIGAVLNIIPILNFFSMGYAVKAGEMTLKKKEGLPEWTDWGDIFIKGLLLFAITLIYAIPAIIIFAISGAAIFSSMISEGAFSMAAIASGGTGILLGMVVLVAIWYILPMAFIFYTDKGDFASAFKFRNILDKIFKTNYFIAWVVSAAVGTVLYMLGGLIPVLSIILVPAASFASMIIMFTLIGEAYLGK